MSRVLVVEDKAANRDLLRYLLEAGGHEVLMAENGAEGVAAADESRPDLVLMDLHMPVMDGFDAVARLKDHAELCRIPVVAVTAIAMVGDREKVLAAGFDGYLTKPIEPTTFVEEIGRFLSNGDGSR